MPAIQQRWAKHWATALTMIWLALLPSLSQAQGVGSVAMMEHGRLLLIMTRAQFCTGHPVAMIVDQHGHKFDQTCDVTYSPGGIATRFGTESSSTFWPKERFQNVRIQ